MMNDELEARRHQPSTRPAIVDPERSYAVAERGGRGEKRKAESGERKAETRHPPRAPPSEIIC